MTRYYVKTVDTGRYLISAGYGSAKWGDFDEATEFHTAEEAARAQRIAGPLEEEGLQLVRFERTVSAKPLATEPTFRVGSCDASEPSVRPLEVTISTSAAEDFAGPVPPYPRLKAKCAADCEELEDGSGVCGWCGTELPDLATS